MLAQHRRQAHRAPTLTTCWSGESCSMTSLPMAFARMFASNSSARQVHVAFQQRLANLRQRGVQVLIGELALPRRF